MSAVWLAGGASLVLSVVAWPWALPALHRLRFRQTVREQGPEAHRKKTGTPTMGGIVFIPAAALAAWAFSPRDLALATALVVMLGSGALGFADDFIKSALGRPLGLRAREKLLGQVILAVGLALIAQDVLDLGTWVAIPFTGLRLELGTTWYVVFVVFLVLGAVNATNLTDGLDGLLSGSGALVAAGFGVIAAVRGELALAGLAAALAGGCLGFLRVNWHPARVFMGDTGSLAIGGALAALAVLTKAEVWLAVLGALFVLEALSVIVQVAAFRLFGRRVLRMSPLHHHFELSGWPERTVVLRLWAFSATLVAVGLAGYLVL